MHLPALRRRVSGASATSLNFIARGFPNDETRTLDSVCGGGVCFFCALLPSLNVLFFISFSFLLPPPTPSAASAASAGAHGQLGKPCGTLCAIDLPLIVRGVF